MKFKNPIYIHFKVEKELKQELQSEAEKKGLALNTYLRMIIANRSV